MPSKVIQSWVAQRRTSLASGKYLRTKPVRLFQPPALFARAVAAASQQETVSIAPEGQPLPGTIHIHPLEHRGILQGQHIGAVLIELQKIAAMLVEEGEMGGHNDLLRLDFPPVGNRLAGPQLPDLGVLIDPQPLGEPCQKF